MSLLSPGPGRRERHGLSLGTGVWARAALGRWALVAACGLGCEAGPRAAGTDPVVGTDPVAPTPAVVAPELLYVGCEAVQAGPVCLLRPGATLRLWVAVHAETPLRLELDGAPLAAKWEPAEDGLRAVLSAPPTGALTLRADDAAWRLGLTLAPMPALPPALEAVHAEISRGDMVAAERALTSALPGLEGAARAEALTLRADVAFMRGDPTAALAAYEPAFAAARAAGLLRRASEVALTASYLCTATLYDLAGARRWLARHAELTPLLPEARLRHGYYAGLVADWAGDLRAAQRSYEAHAATARALGLDSELAAALSALGVLRGRVGDAAGAERAFAELLALGERIPVEVRALALHNAAWTALEARSRGQAAPDPEPQLRAAAALFAPDGPRPDPLIAAELRINLVYAMLVRGDAAAARAALAGTAAPTRTLQRWRDFLAARVALLEDRPTTALRELSAVRAAAAEAGDRGLEWSATLGAGEALERLGRDEAALERYRHAAAMHAGDLAALAVDAGRERFAAERDRGAQRLVLLLLRLGRAGEALCAARRARAQGLAGLAAAARDPAALAAYREARELLDAKIERSWELSRRTGERARAELRAERRRLDATLDAALAGADDLSAGTGRSSVAADLSAGTGRSTAAADLSAGAGRPTAAEGGCAGLRGPGDGELLLVYYPVDAGYVGFGLDAAGLTTARVPGALAADPDARARQLLGPFAAALGRARRVAVIASGPLSAEGFHALPWAGGALIDAAVVTYALDLPRRTAGAGPLTRAVQLAPPSNLAGAAEELASAAAGLRARGLAVERLTGDEADLLARIAGADLLHYAGHARGEGWGGALELGGERSLGARDLLSVAAPRVAVLSGCETGLPDPRAHAGGMSLAHALLLAGAQAVLATDAVVDDELGALGSAVVLAIADGLEPAAALAAVQRADKRPGWARFRAFTP